MLRELRQANIVRQAEWGGADKLDLSYKGNELAGEVGEACNVIKKLERSRFGIQGSRDTLEHLGEELADVIICVDLICIKAGINLEDAIRSKFNKTSENVGLANSTMSKGYIIHKAVEIAKVKKKLQLTMEEYGQRYWAFRKYDGCCAILKDGKTFSRTGEEYQCLNEMAEFLDQYYPDHVFIGEAWWPGKDQFNLISGEFRRQKVSDKLLFMVHDVIPKADFGQGACYTPFKLREFNADIVDGDFDNRIRLAEGWGAGAYGDPQSKCNELVDEGGYDGLILRDPDAGWAVGAGTEGAIIKIKRKLSFDLRVVERNSCIGEKTGRTVWKLVCEFNGKRLGVGSGLPHDLADVPTVGNIVEVEAMDYSSDGLLREPRYKGIRFDKLAPDR